MRTVEARQKKQKGSMKGGLITEQREEKEKKGKIFKQVYSDFVVIQTAQTSRRRG